LKQTYADYPSSHAVLGLLSNVRCWSPSTFKHFSQFESNDVLLGFIGTSIILNLVLTALIAHKLYSFRSSMSRVTNTGTLRSRRKNDPYSSIITIVVESAAAWTIAAFAFLVVAAIQVANPSSNDHGSRQIDMVCFFLEYIFQIVVVSQSIWFAVVTI
jgi:succinate dehydrogenase/fumarate reductase cytochrome b subunit